MDDQKSDVDINVLVKLYNQRLSTLVNQNVFLEAKIQTMTQEFAIERQKLIDININMQKDYESKYPEEVTNKKWVNLVPDKN